MTPHLIFGTASFGMDLTDFQDPESVKNLLQTLQELGIRRLDSGARYPPLNPGRAEQLIGETKELSGSFVVDTKIYTNTQNDGSGDLRPEAIDKSVNASLQRLKRPEGKCLKRCFICASNTAGRNQAAIRETTIWSHAAWRQNSCPFYALTACRSTPSGFLTGKLVNNQHANTRFGDDHPLGKAAQKLFGAEDLHSAMKKFDADVKATGLTPMEVAIRWIAHHSALKDEDGIVIGASKAEQIRETVTMIRKGPLPAEVLEMTEELWNAVKKTRGGII
ncbi:Oxidoreductase [Rasamsonia emersonii CBS 393.64]|uniref:Oxidoreductase n=1 Tax=Rasamsonia emersonii (strain ATCC 16479 / CBS 393.64 / IMI 116815) TaxID=1408163 RepID=A0A0F4YE44_RASE3|nr:Oxidoreductase [Rasamsonia emersonii CBS 393.64]KKA16459.1 Oxidoreductase [Rasamsonia emersonii CBS 393.64]